MSNLETKEQLADASNDKSDPIEQISEEIDTAANTPSLAERSVITAITHICVPSKEIPSGAHSCGTCERACHAIPPCSIADEAEEEV